MVERAEVFADLFRRLGLAEEVALDVRASFGLQQLKLALRFDAFGSPDQTDTASVTLSAGTATITVEVAPGSGEVSIP